MEMPPTPPPVVADIPNLSPDDADFVSKVVLLVQRFLPLIAKKTTKRPPLVFIEKEVWESIRL